MAEHAPITLERSMFLDFRMSGASCSARAHSAMLRVMLAFLVSPLWISKCLEQHDEDSLGQFGLYGREVILVKLTLRATGMRLSACLSL